MEHLSFLETEKITPSASLPAPVLIHRMLDTAHFATRRRLASGTIFSVSRSSMSSRGFTLVEMLIVLAIIVIISAIVFSGQSGFNRTLALHNTAYDIALTIQQAQSYGLSSQAVGAVRNAGYGVSFQGAPTTSYVFFADTAGVACGGAAPDCKPGDTKYVALSDALIQTYTLNNGFTISDFCVAIAPNPKICAAGGGNLAQLVITFTRPNTVTGISGRDLASVWTFTYTNACIKLLGASGDARYVSVSQTGQVQAGPQSIDLNTCP